MRVASIGIGTNSLRMLIADIENGKLVRKERFREGLRITSELDSSGNISQNMIAKTCEHVKAFQTEALQHDTDCIHLFATSAVRDAKNRLDLASALFGATGLHLDICSGEREAALSFWGAVDQTSESALIDIGGGSTEIAYGNGKEILFAESLQLGAVRLFRQQLISNQKEAESAVFETSSVLRTVVFPQAVHECQTWVGVGGTFTTIAAFLRKIPISEKGAISGTFVSEKDVEEAIRFLAPLSVEDRKKLPFLQPQRADIVVHGLAILDACFLTFGMNKIMVSECGNLEGYLKERYLF